MHYSISDIVRVFTKIEPHIDKMIVDTDSAIQSYKRRKSQGNADELKRLHEKQVDLEAFRDILKSLRDSPTHVPRSETLHGTTYKVKPPVSEDAIYITINSQEFEDGPRPVEVFVNSKDMQNFQWITALMRLFSAILQQPGPFPAFAIKELKETYDPHGKFFYEKKQHNSVVSLIGAVIERHCEKMGVLS